MRHHSSVPAGGGIAVAVAFALLIGLTPPAAATQDRPLTSPARDVAVTYRLGAAVAGPAQEMHLSWLAAEQRMRLDMPGQGYMVIDQREQRAFMVMDEQRMAMEIPFAQNTRRMGQLPAGARLTREGEDRVADTPCTVWAYQEGGRTGRTCITEDGVVLRVQSADGPEESMEASAVAYGPQDPARFRPPADFTVLSMVPDMPGGNLPGNVSSSVAGLPGPMAFPGSPPPIASAPPLGAAPFGTVRRTPPAGTYGAVSTGSSSSSSSAAAAWPTNVPPYQPR
ncbi:MAG: hypothetical protein IRZ13_12130 [Acetobacteraceae bacterium]|nr:hypothetical protein [Acetobacteraceae bacterium]